MNEASLAACGVRVITHDDVRQIDDGYLRINANGAQAHLNCIGMAEQIVVDDPCMRIISKNPAGASTGTRSLKARGSRGRTRSRWTAWSGSLAYICPDPAQGLQSSRDPL